MVIDRVGWTTVGGVVGRFADMTVGRGMALRVLEKRSALLARRCAELGRPRWSSARRSSGMDGCWRSSGRSRTSHAGQWELPGGRVEPARRPTRRWCASASRSWACRSWWGSRSGRTCRCRRTWCCGCSRRRSPAVEPEALEHNAVRWVTADELPGLDWLPADRVLVPGPSATSSTEPGEAQHRVQAVLGPARGRGRRPRRGCGPARRGRRAVPACAPGPGGAPRPPLRPPRSSAPGEPRSCSPRAPCRCTRRGCSCRFATPVGVTSPPASSCGAPGPARRARTRRPPSSAPTCPSCAPGRTGP